MSLAAVEDEWDSPAFPAVANPVAISDDGLANPQRAGDFAALPVEPPADLQLADPSLDSETQITEAAVDSLGSGSQAESTSALDAMNQMTDALKTVIPDLLRQIVKNTANPPTAVIGP